VTEDSGKTSVALLESLRTQLAMAIADEIGIPLRAAESAVATVTTGWVVTMHWDQNRALFRIEAPNPLQD
jgi:hypothetical protein